jgi:type I restriction enzyme S subunit
MATSQDFVNWVCSEQLDYRYLKYILLSEHESMLRFASGTTHQTIYFPEAKAFHALLPRVEQQRKIADILQSLDDRIALLRETNTTLEAIAQALFKSWFVDFDPVRAKAEGRQPEGMEAPTAVLFPDNFEESGLGLVPKGWKMSTLGAICGANGGAIQTGPFGSQLHASDYVAEGVPVVMPKDISNRRVDASTAARVGFEDVQRLARHQLRDGDIVFSRRGDVEKHALIGEAELGWLCGTGCLLVRPGSRRNVAGFLSRSLDLPHIKKWLTQHAVGATMPNLNTGILSAVPVVLPTDEVLAAFDETTIALDRRISANNAAAQTLTQLRDTLLPRLISGQLRLPETETMLENIL